MRKALALLAKRSEIGVAAISLLVVLIFTATSGGIWLSRINMVEVLRVTSVLAIMALGEAFVITLAIKEGESAEIRSVAVESTP